MATEEGKRLAALMHDKVTALKDVCEGIDEETAARAPEGRWSPREILSHITGPEGIGMLGGIQRFVTEYDPLINMVPQEAFMTERRAGLSFRALLAEAEQEYRLVASYIETLTDEQLGRRAHIPMLKDSFLGEHPTLAMWVQAIAEYHLVFHIAHMKEILQEIRK